MRKITSTLVITSDALRFVHNRELEADDYAVVIPKMLHFNNGFVRGVVLDSRGQRSKFAMPTAEFDKLTFSDTEEPPVPDTSTDTVRSAT